MPLKSETVEAIFGRMLARYGSSWSAKWAGVPQEAVKADWAEELSGFSRESILYALRYLPLEFPPNAAQFAAICNKAPAPEKPLQLSPPRDPAKAAQVAATVKQAIRPDGDPKAWAYRMKAADLAGVKITATMRTMYRAVTDPARAEVSA